MSDKKTLEQIRDNGSKRHCWPREQISDVYEYGYIAGFDASTAIHQERTKKLLDLIDELENYLNWRTDDLVGDDLIGDQKHTKRFNQLLNKINEVKRQVLQEWGDFK